MHRSDRPLLGISCCLGGLFVFSFQDAVVKWLSPDYGVAQVLLVRTVVVAALVGPLLWRVGRASAWRTRQPGLHLWRGAFATAAYTFYYLAVAAMPLADVAALYAAAPLFLTALSVPLLGEQVGRRRWSAVAIGMVGVLVMLRPGTGVFQGAGLFALASAGCYATMTIVTRRLGAEESALAMTFYTNLVYMVAAGIAVAWLGTAAVEPTGDPSRDFLLRPWRDADAVAFALMALGGVIATGGFFLLAQAYRETAVSLLAPFEYSYLVWATLIGFAIWGDVPDAVTVAGAALVAGSGIYVVRREAVLRDDEPAAMEPPSPAAAPGAEILVEVRLDENLAPVAPPPAPEPPAATGPLEPT